MTTPPRPSLLALSGLLALPLLGGAGCTPPAEPPPSYKEDDTEDLSRQIIGKPGGRILTPDGASVVVPPDALDSDHELRISQGTSSTDFGVATLPEGFAALSTVVVTPHGTAFAIPATLSMPTGADLGAQADEVAVMGLDDMVGTDWEPEGPVEVVDGVASVDIDGFSVYSLATVAAGACPCWSGAQLRGWAAAATSGGLETRFANWAGGTYGVKTCSTFQGSGMLAKQAVTWTSTGEMSCTNWGDSTYGGAWPPATTTLTSPQYSACWGLMRAACIYARSVVQLGVYATNLPSGETVTVAITTTPPSGSASTVPVTIALKDDLVWHADVFDEGTTYEVSVSTQPASAVCTVAAPTGTLSGANAAAEITCAAPSVQCPCFDDRSDFDTARDLALAADPAYTNAACGEWVDPSDAVTAIFFGDECTERKPEQWGVIGVIQLFDTGKYMCTAPPGAGTTDEDITADELAACKTLVYDWAMANGLICPQDSCLY